MEDLGQLIRDCSAGKSRAQSDIYKLFAPKMYGVCLMYSKDTSEAEDSLQDGFLKVFEKIGTFRHEGSFEGWVRRIMVNISLGKYRSKQIFRPVEDISVFEEVKYSNDIIEDMSANELLRLIQELPPRYKMVFNLYVIEGFNHKEISEMMNISEGTSKSNLSRARIILKNKVTMNFGI